MNDARMKFIKLLDPAMLRKNDPYSVGEQQLHARTFFPYLVEQSHLHYWRIGDPISQTGTRLLIGLGASFCLQELHLADVIDHHMSLQTEDSTRVDLFDVLIPVESEFDDYIPGMGHASTTPIVGVWREGVFSEMFVGCAAMDFLLEVLNTGLSDADFSESYKKAHAFLYRNVKRDDGR